MSIEDKTCVCSILLMEWFSPAPDQSEDILLFVVCMYQWFG